MNVKVKNSMIGNTKLSVDAYSKCALADENLFYAIFLVSTEVQFPKERGWLASVPI